MKILYIVLLLMVSCLKSPDKKVEKVNGLDAIGTGGAILGFTIIDAIKNEPISELENLTGSVLIDVNTLPDKIDVQVEIEDPMVQSVAFYVGEHSYIDNSAPFRAFESFGGVTPQNEIDVYQAAEVQVLLFSEPDAAGEVLEGDFFTISRAFE